MKGRILKNVIAAAIVLTLVSGAAPITQLSDIIGDFAITVNAVGTESIGSYEFKTDDEQNLLIESEEDRNRLADAVKSGKTCVGYGLYQNRSFRRVRGKLYRRRSKVLCKPFKACQDYGRLCCQGSDKV